MSANTFVDENMRVRPVSTEGLTFHSPDAEFFELNGFYWRKKGEPFRRLPRRSGKYPFSDNLNDLANFSAGGELRFRSNATKIVVRARIACAYRIVRMALTGTMGFDLYTGEGKNCLFRKVSIFDTDAMDYTAVLWESSEAKMRSFSIYFPLYAEVASVEFGFNAEARSERPKPRNGKCIVAYGTSILHGACANRPGNAYPAILGRHFNCPVLNLGFAGNARGEPFMAQALAEVKEAGLFLLDYDANVDAKRLSETLEPFVGELRAKHPETPILLISSQPHGVDVAEDGSFASERLRELDSLHRGVLERRRAAGDRNIHFISGSELWGDDPGACSADGIHATDYGFAKMAEGIARRMEPFLKFSAGK